MLFSLLPPSHSKLPAHLAEKHFHNLVSFRIHTFKLKLSILHSNPSFHGNEAETKVSKGGVLLLLAYRGGPELTFNLKNLRT